MSRDANGRARTRGGRPARPAPGCTRTCRRQCRRRACRARRSRARRRARARSAVVPRGREVRVDVERLAQPEQARFRPGAAVPLRPADGAEQDGIGGAARVQRLVGQRRARRVDRVAAEGCCRARPRPAAPRARARPAPSPRGRCRRRAGRRSSPRHSRFTSSSTNVNSSSTPSSESGPPFAPSGARRARSSRSGSRNANPVLLLVAPQLAHRLEALVDRLRRARTSSAVISSGEASTGSAVIPRLPAPRAARRRRARSRRSAPLAVASCGVFNPVPVTSSDDAVALADHAAAKGLAQRAERDARRALAEDAAELGEQRDVRADLLLRHRVDRRRPTRVAVAIARSPSAGLPIAIDDASEFGPYRRSRAAPRRTRCATGAQPSACAPTSFGACPRR